LTNGKCRTCFDYSIPDKDRKECIMPECGKNYEVVKDGTCTKQVICPWGYEK